MTQMEIKLQIHRLMKDLPLVEIIRIAASAAWVREEHGIELELRKLFKEVTAQDEIEVAQRILARERLKERRELARVQLNLIKRVRNRAAKENNQ